MVIVRAIPEQGQLVNVRSRQFVVTDVRNTTLPTNPMLNAVEKTQHLVSLSSVEDDGLGEELQVIWELEPGALVYEKLLKKRLFSSPQAFATTLAQHEESLKNARRRTYLDRQKVFCAANWHKLKKILQMMKFMNNRQMRQLLIQLGYFEN